MAEVPDVVTRPGACVAPLDVRDPELILALADTVAILGADFRPRLSLSMMGRNAGFGRAGDTTTHAADWIHESDYDLVVDALARCRAQPGVDIHIDVRVRHDFDGWHSMTLVFRNLLDHPEIQGILVRAIDQTVFDREARWRTLVSETPIGIYEQNLDGACMFVNPAFERILDLEPGEALGFGWCRAIHPDDLAMLKQIQRNATPTQEHPAEVRVRRSDGTERWVAARAVPLRDADGRVTGSIGTCEDITDRKCLEARLEYDATHDRLTGLGSRALLSEELNAALARSRRGTRLVGVLFIDLDGFKRVNDMLGHGAGDDLLIAVGARLRSVVREGDVSVRLGGDEFVVCCPDMESVGQACALADRLLAALSEPYDVHGHELLVGASIGIATAVGEDPLSADQLLSNADVACYRAKKLGRGRAELFDENLKRQLAQGRRIARTVSRLLDEPRLPILCTPIADLAACEIVGFDCDVDWRQAGLDDIHAIQQVVEESGMSRALDLAMLRTIIAQLAEWQKAPPAHIVPGLSMVLTHSGALSPVMAELVRDLLARSRVPAALCWIGIPESAIAHDFTTASRVGVALEALGLGVGLRDFGSAVSSLEQLRSFPMQTMTIASPLVAALRSADDDAHASLVAAIVQYACALGRIVVANDVVDHAHVEQLRTLGCDFGAGNAFGPTLRPAEIPAFLAARSA